MSSTVGGALSGIWQSIQSLLGGARNVFSGIAAAGRSIASSAAGAAASIAGKLVAAFKTLWDIGSKTFGGISKALAAGDLAAAGAIGMAGLKLAVLSGVKAIRQILTGELTQSVDGGFSNAFEGVSSAWSTGVELMAAVWDQFVSGIVSAFASATKAIAGLWFSTQKKIANFILEDAAKGGMLGKLGLLGTGVDMQTEQGRAEADRLKEIATQERLLDQARKNLEAAKAAEAKGETFANPVSQIEETAEGIQTVIDDLEKSLAKLGAAPANVLADAQDIVDQQIDSTADKVASALDQMQERAAANAAKSGEKLANFLDNNFGDQAIQDAQKELDELLNKFAAAGKEAAKNAKAAAANIQKQTSSFADKIAGTFSANAASRMFSGKNYAQKTAKATEDTSKKLDTANKFLKQLKDATGMLPVGAN